MRVMRRHAQLLLVVSHYLIISAFRIYWFYDDVQSIVINVKKLRNLNALP